VSGPTIAELTGVVLRLAANYGKTFNDDATTMALIEDWAEQLSGYDFADIELARKGMMGDPLVRYFPPISDFRRRVQLARADRRREDGEGDGCGACVGSGGSVGWQHAGDDANGYWFVRPCLRGCKPPRGGHKSRPAATSVQGDLVAHPERAQMLVRGLAARLRSGELARLAAVREPARTIARVDPHDSDF